MINNFWKDESCDIKLFCNYLPSLTKYSRISNTYSSIIYINIMLYSPENSLEIPRDPCVYYFVDLDLTLSVS